MESCVHIQFKTPPFRFPQRELDHLPRDGLEGTTLSCKPRSLKKDFNAEQDKLGAGVEQNDIATQPRPSKILNNKAMADV